MRFTSMMVRIERALVVMLVSGIFWATPPPGAAQSASESRAFSAAVQEFEDGIYPLAEKEFAEFVRTFPASGLISEALLYQARSAIKQQKFEAALSLLNTNTVVVPHLADQYRYWLADAYLQSTNYEGAGAAFASLTKDFPNSNLLLEASYGEALARFRLHDWPRVINLLQQPNGTFRREALLRPANVFAIRGVMLRSEALLEQKQYRAAEEGLQGLAEENLTPEFKWRRQYLLCRMEAADQRLAEGLADSTNLLALAVASGERDLVAESTGLQAEILERLDQIDAAVQVYEKNLADNVPVERARQALLKITELTLAQDKVADAARKLETFLVRHPDDAASDVALLTAGELQLKQYLAAADTNRTEALTNNLPAVTNLLQQALLNFERIITNRPQSRLVGKAHLNQGWCLWADGRIAQSQAAFKLAAEELPHSEEQALARFKLAEGQFSQKDYTNAVLNFRSVLSDFPDLPRVKDRLVDQALYQIVRASLNMGDVPNASEAMKKILASSPDSFFGDRSMLLVGQHLTIAKRPSEARLVFQDLIERFPESALRPEIELAVARTFVQEADWLAAIGKYEEWLETFRTNELRAQAEFNRAWANSQAGEETNALSLFSKFVARFPTNELAPRAQYWIASFYYNQKDFVSAEKNFGDKLLLQNTNYAYQALMMAGRAAIGRQAYDEAKRDYFQRLIQDNNCPEELKAEAYFALGDTITKQASEPGKPLQKFDEALVVFKKIPSLYQTSRLTPRAWGRIGDCYLQLATLDTKQYDKAIDAYQKAMTNTADVSARSQAEVGLGLALEAMAKASTAGTEMAAALEIAFRHYANVIYEKNLEEGEGADPFWLKEAGFAAARLAEDRKQWDVAISLYHRLLTRLPPLSDLLQPRINRARDQARLAVPFTK